MALPFWCEVGCPFVEFFGNFGFRFEIEREKFISFSAEFNFYCKFFNKTFFVINLCIISNLNFKIKIFTATNNDWQNEFEKKPTSRQTANKQLVRAQFLNKQTIAIVLFTLEYAKRRLGRGNGLVFL